MSNELNGAYGEIALGQDRKFATFLPTKIPTNMSYNNVSVGPAGMRQEIEILAESGTSFSASSNKITFPVRSQKVMDFQHAYLEFGAIATVANIVPGGGTFGFCNGIWNLFERIVVKNNGGQVIFEQTSKNLFRSLIWAFCRADKVDATLGDACWGVAPAATRYTRASGWNYCIPLDIPFMTADEIPFMNIQNFTIEVYLEQASNVIVYGTTTAGTPDYTITNPRIRAFEVDYQPDLPRKMMELPFIMLPFTTYKCQQFQMSAGANITQAPIPIHVQSVKRVLAFMRANNKIGVPTVMDPMTTAFDYNSAVKFQLKVDNTYYPQMAYKAGGGALIGAQEAYLSAYRAIDRYESFSDAIDRRNNGETNYLSIIDWQPTYAEFTNNKFVMAVDVKTFAAHDELMFTKFDLTPGNTQLQLNIDLASGQPTTSTTLYMFVVHNSMCVLYPNGTFILIE